MLADIWDIGFTKKKKKKTYESYWVYFLIPNQFPKETIKAKFLLKRFFFLPKSKPIICCIQVNLLMAQKSGKIFLSEANNIGE